MYNEIYVILSAITAIAIWQWYRDVNQSIQLAHLAIVLWSGFIYLTYFVVGTDAGASISALSSLVDTGVSPYYIDWIISTPLIIWAFCQTVGIDWVKPVFLQIGIIGTGIISDLSSEPMIWYLIGVGLMFWLFYDLFVDDTTDVMETYPILSMIIIGTWAAYAYIWYLTAGDLQQAQFELVLVPLISKHLFAILDLEQFKNS